MHELSVTILVAVPIAYMGASLFETLVHSQVLDVPMSRAVLRHDRRRPA